MVAYNEDDTNGVTLDFEVKVLDSGKKATSVTVGVLTAVIFLIIVAFTISAWAV